MSNSELEGADDVGHLPVADSAGADAITRLMGLARPDGLASAPWC